MNVKYTILRNVITNQTLYGTAAKREVNIKAGWVIDSSDLYNNPAASFWHGEEMLTVTHTYHLYFIIGHLPYKG